LSCRGVSSFYAEGNADETQIAFATHDIVVEGAGLTPLLQAITANLVAAIREPARSDRFPAQSIRFIREIDVRRADGN